MMLRILKIILLLLLMSGNLYSEALFAGSVTTVNSDSSFNALRNPALMSNQSEDNISLLYQYSYLLASDAETDITVSSVNGRIDSTFNENYNGALFFSSLTHSGRSSYGVGITKNGDDQIKLSSSEADTQIAAFTANTIEENKFFGVNFLFSYSFKINNRESIGFQLENSASYESTEKDEVNSNPETRNLVVEKTRITAGGRFGYNLREENFDFGAIVSTGSYGVENKKYELTSNLDGYHEHELSNYYMHDDGFGVLLGICLKSVPKWKVSIEGGYIVPFSFDEKNWSDDSYNESTSEISIVYTALVRGGVNYRYNRFIDFGFGGSYITYKAKSSGDESVQVGTTTLFSYQLTSGIDIKPSKDYTLLFGLSLTRSVLESVYVVNGTSANIFSEKNSVEVLCGVSCNF